MKQSREKFNPVMLCGTFGFTDDVSRRVRQMVLPFDTFARVEAVTLIHLPEQRRRKEPQIVTWG